MTSLVESDKLGPLVNTKHGDENQYTPLRFLRELPVGARQRRLRCGIPFGVALLNPWVVGGDGYGPIQPAGLSGPREAADAVN